MGTEREIEAIVRAKEEWAEKLKKKATDKAKAQGTKEFKTDSEISIDPIYTPVDLDGQDYLSELGLPGDYPFTRGVQPDMYRGRLWTMRQYAGFGTAAETNSRFKYLLEQGQMGLSVAFDLVTQIGYKAGQSGRSNSVFNKKKSRPVPIVTKWISKGKIKRS